MSFTSVLVTGNSCAGKTSLIDNLYDALSSVKATTRNKFDLCKSEQMRKALRIINQEEAGSAREANELLLEAHLLDGRYFSAPAHEGFLLQDSYWERVAAFCRSHDLEDLAKRFINARNELYVFDINILLWAQDGMRERRALHRGRETINGTNTEIFDGTIKEITQRNPNYLFVDTTGLSLSDVTRIALEHIRGCL